VLDDVLDLTINDILERRLQTVVFNKGLTKSIHQARQLITHGHISIGGKKVTAPSYLVLRDEEAQIAYAPTSGIASPEHPMRQSLAGVPPKTETARGEQAKEGRSEEKAP
jgi:small subunit ribosomal protein S4